MITLNIEGMMCEKCVMHVSKALKSVEGATDIVVNLEKNIATLQNDADMLEKIKEAVEDAGYTVTSSEIS